MNTPLQAILWELWRTGRNEWLFRMTWCVVIVFLCLGQLGGLMTDLETLVLHGCLVFLLVAMSIFSAAGWGQLDSQNRGFSYQLGFVRPVSTFQLVAVPMLFSMIGAFVCYAVPATILHAFSGPFPVLGPALIVTCVSSWFMASCWSPTTIIGKRLSVLLLMVGAIVGLVWLHWQSGHSEPLLMVLGRPVFFQLPWYNYVGLVLITALSFGFTMTAVERQRHGDSPVFGGIFTTLVARLRRRPRTTITSTTFAKSKPFAGRVSAQVWYEVRRLGPSVWLLSIFSIVLIAGFATVVPLVKSGWNGSAVAWLIGLVISPFAFQLIGADGAIGLRKRDGAVWLSEFDATRPMSNDHLIGTKLLVIGLCTLIGWLLMAVAATVHTAIFGNWQLWVELGEWASKTAGDVPWHWWLAGIASAAMAYIGSTSVFLAFGYWLPKHPKLFAFLSMTFYGSGILGFLTVKEDWPLRSFWMATGYLASLAIVVACVLALRKALLAGYLGKRLFAIAFCLWGVYVTSAVTLYINANTAWSIPLPALAVAVSLLVVPLAATAAAPLALASHRHA